VPLNSGNWENLENIEKKKLPEMGLPDSRNALSAVIWDVVGYVGIQSARELAQSKT
jgi:hypothetical protein